MLDVAARALQSSLAPVSALTISFERIETNMDTVSIDNRDSKAVVAKFELRAGGRTGRLQLVIPQSAVRSTRAQASAEATSVEEGRRSPAGSARCSRRSTIPR